MPTLSSIRHSARAIAMRATDPQVIDLAKVVESLCKKCEELETTAQNALNKAKHAEVAAKKR